MPLHLMPYLAHWAISALALWAASHVFSGLQFARPGAILVAGLLLAVVNAVVKPLLIVLTLPLTFLTLGLFLLVINALMLMLVARLVQGFYCRDFRTAFVASLFIGVLTIVLESWIASPSVGMMEPMPHSGLWL